MKIFNTLSGKKENFVPIEENKIKIKWKTESIQNQGYLSVKKEKEEGVVSLGCSDGSIKFIKLENG